MKLGLLGLIVTGVIWGTTTDAGAYFPKGNPWPGGVVRYYNAASDQAWPVARAVDVWNRSGARVRFVPSSRADAQLVIEHFSHNRCVSHAEATVGYVPHAVMHVPRVDERSPVCNSYSSVHMVAHELGHVLGLGHETRGCALMNPSGTWRGASLCPQAAQWTWRCGLLELDDVAGAVRMYGGRAAVTPQSCPAYGAIGSAGPLRAEYLADRGATWLRFVRPSQPRLPLFLAERVSGEGGYVRASAQNACPTEIGNATKYRWTVAVGREESLLDRRPPGKWCYAVWALDSLGRPSDRPAYAWVDVPAPVRR